MLCGFPKVGSREQVFLESVKNKGSWERKFRNFASLELKFWPATRLKMQNFSENANEGHMSCALSVNW